MRDDSNYPKTTEAGRSAVTRRQSRNPEVELPVHLYADACPHCHEELKHNTRPLSAPKQDSRKAKAWPVQMFSRLLRFGES